MSRSEHKSKDGIIFFKGDLLDVSIDFFEFLENVDVLYHCAGELYQKEVMEALHVEGTKRLLEAAIGKIGRWVQLSSVGAYGVFNGVSIDESTQEKPIGTYEKTKAKSDYLLEMVAKNKGLKYVILRPSIVFGESMSNCSLLDMLFVIRKGWFFYVNRNANVNYVHVEDVVDALILCGESSKAINNIYILSDSTTLKIMVDSFSSGMGVNHPKIYFPEFLIRPVVSIFGRLPNFPLTKTRLDVLTNLHKYNSCKIQKDLDFSFKKNLDTRFREYAKNYCK